MDPEQVPNVDALKALRILLRWPEVLESLQKSAHLSSARSFPFACRESFFLNLFLFILY